MEPEGEWSYFNSAGMYSPNEEADFMAQMLGNSSLQDDLPSNTTFKVPPTFWPGHESTVKMAGPNNIDTNMDSCYSGRTSMLPPNSSQESYNPSDFNQILVTNSSDYSMQEMKNTTGKEEPEISMTDPSPQGIFNNVLENCKKRSRNLADVHKERNVKPKKANKSSNNTTIHRPNSSSYCSENDCNIGSWEFNVETNSSSIGAGNGAAADSHSLHARVDISTMLEGAVKYVKFLQLQIKLFSSNDLWMYAPTAYNGIDVGLFGMPRRLLFEYNFVGPHLVKKKLNSGVCLRNCPNLCFPSLSMSDYKL